MLATFLSVHPEYSKYAAWLTLILLFAFGGHALKQVLVALVMKVYEFFIQKNEVL